MTGDWLDDDPFGCNTVDSESSAILSAKTLSAIPSTDSTSVLLYTRKVEFDGAHSTIFTPSFLKMEEELIRSKLQNFEWTSWEAEHNMTPAFKIAMCLVGFPSLRSKSGGKVTEMIGQIVPWAELQEQHTDANTGVEELQTMCARYIDDLNEQGKSFIGACIPELIKGRLKDGLLPISEGSAGDKMLQRAVNAAFWWQQIQGDSDMAVGYREFGQVLGFHKDYARLLLKDLVTRGYVRLVSKGRPGRQSRWRFIGREKNGVLVPAGNNLDD